MNWRTRIRQAALALLVTILTGTGCLLVALRAIPFPEKKLDHYPHSPVVTDQTGRILLAVVGQDDQIRHPVPLGEMSPWLAKAAIAVEDERFRSHFGVDPLSILRAIGQNLTSMRIQSGASTITMQVCKMIEEQPRTLWAKATEAFRALQLENTRCKDDILEHYLNMIPCGSNIRGVEAASRRYFNKQAADLSLAEAALIAGLPQSPNRYRPDRHPEMAVSRRNMVLYRMLQTGNISPSQYRSASNEALILASPGSDKLAPHVAWMAIRRRPDGGHTTIDLELQGTIESLAQQHKTRLSEGTQIAVVVIEIETGNVVALLGSTDYDENQSGQVNGAIALRSPGSTLKPFIYATAFEDRRLSPDTLLPDIPIERKGWAPQNFDKHFHDDVSVREALRRSLNIPAILTAEGTGIHRCAGFIESAGISLPEGAVERAGSGLAVGATEVSLIDLVNGYATLGRDGVYQNYRLFCDEATESRTVFRASTCAAINQILSCREKQPNGLQGIANNHIPWFMWKTGTSSGRRDAWAVGHNHKYAVGVWTGRFSGAGDPHLVGALSAEPLLSRIFYNPLLRNEHPCLPLTMPFPVTNPLELPRQDVDSFSITSPRSGGVYYMIDGVTTLVPQCCPAEPNPTWFLNGKLVQASARKPLTLKAGEYELLCISSDSQHAVIRFTVTSQQ